MADEIKPALNDDEGAGRVRIFGMEVATSAALEGEMWFVLPGRWRVYVHPDGRVAVVEAAPPQVVGKVVHLREDVCVPRETHT